MSFTDYVLSVIMFRHEVDVKFKMQKFLPSVGLHRAGVEVRHYRFRAHVVGLTSTRPAPTDFV